MSPSSFIQLTSLLFQTSFNTLSPCQGFLSSVLSITGFVNAVYYLKLMSAQLIVCFIQPKSKVPRDNRVFTVCLLSQWDHTAGPKQQLSAWDTKSDSGEALTHALVDITDLRRTWWSTTHLAGDMDGFYSMKAVEQEEGTKFKESFKLVSEVKRDVWKVSGEGLSEPSCCLSVNNISYTVR